jgi:hypothetical protein
MPISLTIAHDRPRIRSPIKDRVRPWFVLLAWFDNHIARQRLQRCASLDWRFAKDIGLTPGELAIVCAAPPWKAVVRPAVSSTSAAANSQPPAGLDVDV